MSSEEELVRVWYWNPCNGIGGRSEDKGVFTKEAAERYINERVGEPGSAKRNNPNNWDRDAYSMVPVEVNR